ncbi:Ktr system potassium uptake protein A [compost metagenome]
MELKVPECLNGKIVGDLNPRARFGCSIVAIHRENGIIIAPTAMDHLAAGDIMVIIGANKNIEEFEAIIND